MFCWFLFSAEKAGVSAEKAGASQTEQGAVLALCRGKNIPEMVQTGDLEPQQHFFLPESPKLALTRTI